MANNTFLTHKKYHTENPQKKSLWNKYSGIRSWPNSSLISVFGF